MYIKNDYIQFHDDVSQFWSIRFAMHADRDEFISAAETLCTIVKESVEDVPKTQNVIANESIMEIPVKENEISSPANSQSTLINRMAKMGQKMIPTSEIPPKENSSDSEDIEPVPSTQRKHIVAPKWKPDVPSRSSINNQLQYPTTSSPPVLSANTLISYNPTVHASMTNDPGMLSLFTENRFQNTEVRMSLSKLESKIERVLDKVDLIRDQSATKPKTDLEEEIIKLEEKLLGLKKENRQLRLDREANRSSDEALMVEKKKISLLEVRLESQRDELEELRNCLTAKNSEIARIDSQRISSDEKSNSEMSQLKTKIEELCNHQSQSNIKIANMNTSIADLEKEKLKVEEQLAMQLQSDANTNGNIQIADVVKDIMNTMYQSFQETISQRSEWSADDVLKLMRTVIKRETMNVLKAHPSP